MIRQGMIGESGRCTQISVVAAVEYLRGEVMEYSTLKEYHDRYCRRIEPDELMDACGLHVFQKLVMSAAKHRAYVDRIMDRSGDRWVKRDDAPPHKNMPFKRFCVVPIEWLDRAFDIMTELEFCKHVSREHAAEV